MYVSRILERARAALPGRRTRRPAPPRRDAPRHASSAPYMAHPGGVGHEAGHRTQAPHRVAHPAPVQAPQPQEHAECFPRRPWETTGSLVRPYVALLGDTPRTARTGIQADPWGDTR